MTADASECFESDACHWVVWVVASKTAKELLGPGGRFRKALSLGKHSGGASLGGG